MSLQAPLLIMPPADQPAITPAKQALVRTLDTLTFIGRECTSVDPVSHEERLRARITGVATLRHHTADWSGIAAHRAASAAMQAHIGVSANAWQRVVAEAFDADRRARLQHPLAAFEP
jgi:hypothetical protein